MNGRDTTETNVTCAAIVVAAGRGLRAGGGIPKQYRKLAGREAVRRTIDALAASPLVGAIQPVIHPDDRGLYDDAMAGGSATLAPVAGGETRQRSVLNGLRALREGGPPKTVLIHDAARPGVDPSLVERVLGALAQHDGAIPALAVVDTLRYSEDGQRCGETVSREGLWRVQTPQGFHFSAILSAHEAALSSGASELTDDAAVAAAAGLDIAIVEGSEENFKLTTERDFSRAESMLRAAGQIRIGLGYDVHRFGPGASVTICGVEVAHDRSLIGHSDADVGLHAITDAILGAVGGGDIGMHFPPGDARWRGEPSGTFLAKAAEMVRAVGGEIVNVDVTVICEAPRIGPHRGAMIARISDVLGIACERVNVKGTTTEKLGFTGRGEGVAAQAVASVHVPI